MSLSVFLRPSVVFLIGGLVFRPRLALPFLLSIFPVRRALPETPLCKTHDPA